ncbi:sensor histidine kinase [Clostridium sp. 'White wine YQ']|uniref:sensor histidine kinase n=1 Tax=Clostridium sp. 'White wine YQ' TaxID=3027474 RepID=UPI0023663E25|nr:HAMP domain-containing sensor histidine kinase [Clostridium sp. 'White wine YQ']MDD7795416.1 HAMP domain-containing sensor histidine kinase [Clostridium sp. 'White wine YQ']
MKRKDMILNWLGVIFTIILFIGCFVSAFYLTSFVYNKIGYRPQNLLAQIINSLLGLFFALIILKVALMFDEHKSGIFDSVITAQKRIARGDYNVNLNSNIEGLGPYSELVDSVNYMALELSKMEKMRQEFISNVSHEIQSPLTSIRGFAQALRNDNLTPENRVHYLNIIEAESMRLSKLSDNLLRLASLESDTIKVEPRTYRLDKQLRHIILSCEPQWVNKNINMDISLETVEIHADEDMMNQVFINLINNSIKFTPEGGSIRINLCNTGDTIDFRITDTGVGIAEDDQAHIFERFFKGDKSRRPAIKGNGLGLSIVKKIVDLHHGTIKIQSKLGEGATFTVSLPSNLNI